MAPRLSAPLRCKNCGWRTDRCLENTSKGCSKCGGRMMWDTTSSEEDRLVVLMVVAALLFMAVIGFILERLR